MTTTFPAGTATLLEELDKKLMVVLRDGRTLIGYLRSIDQFANLVLHQTIERIYVGKEYGDIPRGIFVIRGENVVLLGEVVSSYDHLKYVIHCGLEIPSATRRSQWYNGIYRYARKYMSFPHWPQLRTEEKEVNLPLKKVSIQDIKEAQRKEQESKQEHDKKLAKARRERGLNFVPDLSQDYMF